MDAPFNKVCYIGCGSTTGLGAVIFTAKVEAGTNCVVFGLRRHRPERDPGPEDVGANMIVGVDVNPAREKMAREWGVSTIIGVAVAGQGISTRPFQLVPKRLTVRTR